jgi:hypothetical protein
VERLYRILALRRFGRGAVVVEQPGDLVEREPLERLREMLGTLERSAAPSVDELIGAVEAMTVGGEDERPAAEWIRLSSASSPATTTWRRRCSPAAESRSSGARDGREISHDPPGTSSPSRTPVLSPHAQRAARTARAEAWRLGTEAPAAGHLTSPTRASRAASRAR